MKYFKVFCVFVLISFFCFSAFAIQKKRTAKVLQIEGPVQVKLVTEKDWIPAKAGMALGENDIVRTRKNSYAIIKLSGAGETAEIELKENSQLMFLELVKDDERKTQDTLLDLAAGEVKVTTKDIADINSRFEVKTPTSVVAVQEGAASFSIRVERLD